MRKCMEICVFGRGKGSSYVARCLDANVNVVAFIDNYSIEKTDDNGIPIIKQGDLRSIKFDYIVISLFKYDRIRELLVNEGIEQDRIICFFDMNDVNKYIELNVLDPFKWRIELIWIYNEEHVIPIINNINYEIYSDAYRNNGLIPNILGADVLIEKIINEGKSLSRFGDGEFEMIAGRVRPKFQSPDCKLGDRLREVLESNEEKLLIAIADNYGSLDKYTDEAKDAIRKYMTKEVRKEHEMLLNSDRIYYDAYFSRPYIMYLNKRNAGIKFESIRRIWNKREVLLIEGAHTRVGVGNDLLDNANEIKRIVVPDKNAFCVYKQIFELALHYGKNKLVLLSIGPTATVLAYDLTINGIQAVDIGQIDNEYEWFLMGAKEKRYIPGKTVSELKDRESFDNEIDSYHFKKYLSQILETVFLE